MAQDNVQLLTNGISKNSGPTISSCMIEIIPTVQLTTTKLQLRAAKKLQAAAVVDCLLCSVSVALNKQRLIAGCTMHASTILAQCCRTICLQLQNKGLNYVHLYKVYYYFYYYYYYH